MSKRPFLDSSSPSQSNPPAKRRQISSFSSSSPSTPRTPRTPHVLVPSDSPTNPFGHDRSSGVTNVLPRPTSFGKHLAFRLQLVRDGGQVRDKEGVYRIVQVPLNYTFCHLHRLLHFLFDGPSPPDDTTNDVDTTSATIRRSTRIREEEKDASSDEELGYLFEVQKSVKLYKHSYKAGQIRSGKAFAKLSMVRDPYRYRGSEGDEDEVFQAGGDVESNVGESENESEVADWRWEVEEDYTLGHVWPKGPDLSRAVIYHHDSRTQIHMTINTLPIASRRGVSNKPFVFRARGIVSLGGEATDDDPKLDVSVSRWNWCTGLKHFLEWFPIKAPEDDARSIEWDFPSNSISSESLPTPGPPASSSTGYSTPFSEPIHTPITPAPTHRHHRLRVNYEHKRIARQAKRGMDEICKDLEDEDEVDELADDTEEDPEAIAREEFTKKELQRLREGPRVPEDLVKRDPITQPVSAKPTPHSFLRMWVGV